MLIGKQLCNKRALSDFYFSVYQSKNIQVNQIHIKKNFRIKFHDFHCKSAHLFCLISISLQLQIAMFVVVLRLVLKYIIILWHELKEYMRREIKPRTNDELIAGIIVFWHTQRH